MVNEKNELFLRRLGLTPEFLQQSVVTVELLPSQAGRASALIAYLMTCNLLARLFETIQLVAPVVNMPVNPWGLSSTSEIAESLYIPGHRVIVGNKRQTDVVIGIGEPPVTPATQSTFVDFGAWTSSLDLRLQPAQDACPIGPLVAACWGAAQVFLYAARQFGAAVQPMAPFEFSAWDLLVKGIDGPGLQEAAVANAHLVGVGAIGSAAIYALGHFASLSGLLHAIDNDIVDEGNLQRYILMRYPDLNKAKVDVAAESLAGRGLAIDAYPFDYDTFLRERGNIIDLLLTPVDSEEGRRHLAKTLPRAVINASTTDTTFTLSRHGFGDGKACLHCLYLPQPNTRTDEERLSEELGIPLDVVITHVTTNTPISEALVHQVEDHLREPRGTYDMWVGKHIQSFYQQAICGQARISMAGSTFVVPAVFSSALAGVLLAAELIKESTDGLQEQRLDNYFRTNSLFHPNPAFRLTKSQEASGRCICHDLDYLEVYRERYPRMPAI